MPRGYSRKGVAPILFGNPSTLFDTNPGQGYVGSPEDSKDGIRGPILALSGRNNFLNFLTTQFISRCYRDVAI